MRITKKSRLPSHPTDDELDVFDQERCHPPSGDRWLEELPSLEGSIAAAQEMDEREAGMQARPWQVYCAHCGQLWLMRSLVRAARLKNAKPGTLPCCLGTPPKGSK